MGICRKIVTAFGMVLLIAALIPPSDLPAAEKPGAGSRAAALARGKYLVNTGGCHDCHTTKIMTDKGPALDTKRLLAGFPATQEVPEVPKGVIGPKMWGGVFTNDLTGWAGPWGVSFASNLTPDKETGIGAWTEGTFIRTLRTGKTPGGRPILPPMPLEAVRQYTDADLKAVYAYLMSLQPVRNMVPAPVPPK